MPRYCMKAGKCHNRKGKEATSLERGAEVGEMGQRPGRIREAQPL